MRYVFILGGTDLEMQEIAKILRVKNQTFFDKRLGWSAKASAYFAEISKVVSSGTDYVLVLVELGVDIELPTNSIIIDHHGDRAGEPASVIQVLNLLNETPTRWQQLVAADDSGGPVGLIAFGATPEEFKNIRDAGRAAQGITPEQEAAAEQAVARAERFGNLVVVRCAHSTCATITDRLFPLWKDGLENVLILSDDGESNYFGDVRVRRALHDTYGGWIGGNPNGNGYWGMHDASKHDQVLDLVKTLAS